MSDLTLPLADIIKNAALTPAEGPIARMKQRFVDCSTDVVVLCDCSGSMNEMLHGLNVSKREHLEAALADVLEAFPKVRVVAFGDYAKEIKRGRQLPRMGGTDMAEGFRFIRQWRPRKTIVISDGEPNNAVEASSAAASITGAIDTIFCGRDGSPTIEWLRSLARDCGGKDFTWDGFKPEVTMGTIIRALLE